MDFLARLNGLLGKIVWGVPMMALLCAVGVIFTVRTGFVQFRRFGYMLRLTFGGLSGNSKSSDSEGTVSSAQALATALAATLGTGNIAGVAGAISLGGPGAVFWMWVSAVLGMATKYAEIVLAVRFREKTPSGDYAGGPMYYIKNGLGRRWMPLAVFFSAAGALYALGTGCMVQANTIAGAVGSLVGNNGFPLKLTVGLATAAIAAPVIFGGMKRIGKAAEAMIPFAAGFYVAAALAVILINHNSVLMCLDEIVSGAFHPSSVIGGAAGISISHCVRLGVGRGVFSNDAGLGTAPIAYASAKDNDPAKQGMLGIFEVFFDTIVVCTMTALAILTSGCVIPFGDPAGAELTMSAFSKALGGTLAGAAVGGGAVLFALTSILSCALYGRRCVEFLFSGTDSKIYLTLYTICIVLGATAGLGTVWEVAGTLGGLMAFPNIIALSLLSGEVREITQKKFTASKEKYRKATDIKI